ncbi:hypothetical protein [Parablautia sp. Marseille-Q6255]|uniref:hypothetical protein n=1 Tax=Parablautia sp. Marseille-Q6255 TaxID=3039593 RepID=UPI0024BC8F9F|nr:hypothetical protein [Parablautia sp. Marseille-Q6255]
MIYIQDKHIKVGKDYLPGIIRSIRISEEGKLEDKKKGKKKVSNQPTGYEAARVEIDLFIEENKKYDLENMIRFVQRLFKRSGQKKQKKYKLTAAEINAHGITEAYFNGISTTKEESQSWAVCTLSFVAPAIAGLKVVRTKKQQAEAKKKKKSKSKKNADKSPAKNMKSKSDAKKKAKKLVKK